MLPSDADRTGPSEPSADPKRSCTAWFNLLAYVENDRSDGVSPGPARVRHSRRRQIPSPQRMPRIESPPGRILEARPLPFGPSALSPAGAMPYHRSMSAGGILQDQIAYYRARAGE